MDLEICERPERLAVPVRRRHRVDVVPLPRLMGRGGGVVECEALVVAVPEGEHERRPVFVLDGALVAVEGDLTRVGQCFHERSV